MFGLLPFGAAMFSGAAHAAISLSERAALIRIYEQTNGDGWIDRSGWKEGNLDSDGFALSGTEHEWNGVYIEEDHVTALFLGSNNLTGTVSSMAGLPYLKHIDFSYNSLSGEIPSDLADISGLEHIDFTSNAFSGRVPPGNTGLTGLTYLSLGDNQLQGEIPPGIGNLAQLTVLNLSFNAFSGAIPSGIGNMAALEYLSLSNNALTGAVPADIGQCARLVELDLSNNRLTGSIPENLYNLGNLQYFSVYENQLTGGISSSIGNLANLNTLYICCNSFEGPLPETLGNLTNLERLHAYENRFSGPIPSRLGNLTNLIDCYLTDNQFSGSLPPELGNLKKLETLEVYNNSLSGEIPSSLGELTSLKRLDLDLNRFEGSIPASLGNLANLEGLYISRNALTGTIPREIGKLKKLEFLKLHDNAIEGAIPEAIGNLSSLKTLSLYNNSLTGRIPPAIGNLTGLEILYLCCNALTGPIPPEIGNLPNLQEMHVFDNALSGAIPPEIGNLTRLVELKAGGNALTGEIPSEIGKLTSLSSLILNDNQLTGNVPESFMNLTRIQEGELNLCGNDLSSTDTNLNDFLDSKHGYDWLECQKTDDGGEDDFYINGLIVNIHHPDGSFTTRIYVCGLFPEPVESLSVAGPSGDPLFDLNSIGRDENSDCYVGKLNGRPEPGEYSFSVSGAGKQFYEKEIYEAGVMPVPDPASMTPADGVHTGSDVPEFTWAPVDYGQPTYYRVEIMDQNNRTVYISDPLDNVLSHTVPDWALEPGRPYSWRLIVADAPDHRTAPHQSRSAWINFTSGLSDQDEIPKPRVLGPGYNALFQGGAVTLSVDGAPIEAHGVKARWKIRRFDRGYACPDCDYDPEIDQTTASASLTVQDSLILNMKYAWKVRFEYDENHYSEWSEERSFLYGELTRDAHGVIPGGAGIENFDMISAVCWPDDPYSNYVFGSAVTDYEHNFRIGTYDPENDWYKVFGSGEFIVKPGVSMWFLSRADFNVVFTGVRVSTEVDIEVDLKRGWNMIACPNPENYEWASVKVVQYVDGSKDEIRRNPVYIGDPGAADLIRNAEYWEWNNGAYLAMQSGVLYARNGYWTNASADHVSLRFTREARIAALAGAEFRKPRRSAQRDGESPPPPMNSLNENLKDDIGGCFLNTLQER